MVVNLVLQLSDGEEMVVEGLEDKSVLDPRERTIEVRRAVQELGLEEERPCERSDA